MKKSLQILFSLNEGGKIPHYASQGAAGADIYANNLDPILLNPSERALIETGLYLEIPEGYEVQIRPRSGLAFHHGIIVLNTPGTIDSDYRGEIKILLINHGSLPFTVERGMRIAQLIVSKVERAEFISSLALSSTARADGGFGHTGV